MKLIDNTRPVWLNYLLALLLVGLLTLPLWLLRESLTLANISLLYMLVILIVAVWLGTGPSLLAALSSFISFNFFLVKPYYTLAVEDPRELIDLFVFLLAAVIAGQVASYARKQAEIAREKAIEENILYNLSSAFNQLTDREAIYRELEKVLREELAASQVILHPTARPLEAASPTNVYLLLQSRDAVYGTVEVGFDAPPTPAQARLLSTFVVQAGMALQRIELSEAVQRGRTLEEADRLKTAILHAVSHDLRTPITIIKTSADSLVTLDERLTPRQRREMAQTIENQADHLNMLVGNLLDLSRLNAGAVSLQLDWNSPVEIAGDVAARVFQQTQQRRIRLEFPDDMPLVRFDYGLMLQALSNIVDNTVRYEPAGKHVIIRGSYDDETARLHIVNHGPTISASEKTLILEPFYHGPDGRIGLGLAISKGIVDAHHGLLAVEDTPGGGATFIITLFREPDENQNNVDPGR